MNALSKEISFAVRKLSDEELGGGEHNILNITNIIQ